PALQPATTGLQEHPLPALELMCGDLALSGDGIERLPAKQGQDQFHLPRGTPPFRQLLRPTRCRRLLTGLRSRWLLGHPNLLGSLPSHHLGRGCPKKSGAVYVDPTESQSCAPSTV